MRIPAPALDTSTDERAGMGEANGERLNAAAEPLDLDWTAAASVGAVPEIAACVVAPTPGPSVDQGTVVVSARSDRLHPAVQTLNCDRDLAEETRRSVPQLID
jgi:hypothetical protein